MESDKPLSIRLPKFRGAAEKWPAWRDAMEAIFGAYKLINAIDTPRPVNAPRPVINEAGAGGGGAGAGGGQAGDAGDGGDGNANAGGGVAVTGGQQPGLPGSTPSEPAEQRTQQELWDEQSGKIYMYLLLSSEGKAQAVVSQYRSSRNGVAAWKALAPGEIRPSRHSWEVDTPKAVDGGQAGSDWEPGRVFPEA